MACTNGNTYDLYIPQGTTWVRELTIKDGTTGNAINITGYSFRGQIRKSYSSATVIQALTFTIINAAAGRVNMSLTATETSAIPVSNAINVERPYTEYIYDAEWIFPDLSVERLLQGQVYVSPEVSR